MVLLKRQVRAVEYRRLALQASVLAEGSTLENVRGKHEVAAARWATLAALDEDAVGNAPMGTHAGASGLATFVKAL